MKEYFEKLLNGPSNYTQVRARPGYERSYILDSHITIEEIEQSIQNLKRKKAPGIDGIPSEALIISDGYLNRVLKDIFNRILLEQNFPESWSIGQMIPIHKSGDRKIPSNYRGITLLPVISKVFTRIIRNRIEMWAEDNSKLNDSQFGFRENRRTIDAIYVLFNTLQVYKKRNKPVFACYVDFAKAFDTINHLLLWEKLSNMGLSDNMLLLLQNMYKKAVAQVQVNTELSDI